MRHSDAAHITLFSSRVEVGQVGQIGEHKMPTRKIIFIDSQGRDHLQISLIASAKSGLSPEERLACVLLPGEVEAEKMRPVVAAAALLAVIADAEMGSEDSMTASPEMSDAIRHLLETVVAHGGSLDIAHRLAERRAAELRVLAAAEAVADDLTSRARPLGDNAAGAHLGFIQAVRDLRDLKAKG